jgi:hypothetical protein
MLRIIHNRSIVKYCLSLVGIGIALYFAWSFYPFGEWAGKQFLSDVPKGPQIMGVICAAVLGGLVLILLFHKEYMREDVRAYSIAKNDTSFIQALNWFVWFVMGLELFSIVFRCFVLNWNKYSIVLFGVGLVGMGLTYIIGKVLHAQVNRPAEVEASRLMNDAQNEVLGRASKDMGKLTSDDLRHVGAGNFHPLNAISDARSNRARAKAAKEEQKHMDWLAQSQQGQQAAKRFLEPRSSDPIDVIPSNNGHSKQSPF